MNAIKTEQLRKEYGDVVAVVNIPFTKCTLFADQVHPFR